MNADNAKVLNLALFADQTTMSEAARAMGFLDKRGQKSIQRLRNHFETIRSWTLPRISLATITKYLLPYKSLRVEMVRGYTEAVVEMVVDDAELLWRCW